MEGDAPAVIGDTSWEGSMGRSILRYKRLGEAYPSGENKGIWHWNAVVEQRKYQ